MKRLRIEAGLTQTGLGQLLGIESGHISKIERGWHTPSASTLVGLAKNLGLTLGDMACAGKVKVAE